jgi:hypothetical protein
MRRFDRNQFLLLAGAIGTATAALGAKGQPGEQTVDGSAAGGTSRTPNVEEDQTATCDGDTGQTGWAKYCPIAAGHRKGCLDNTSCVDLGLKAASELRYFDCLANTPTSACASEGGGDPFVRNPHVRCSQQVVNHACPDPLAEQTCQRAGRLCGARPSPQMVESCAIYVTPLTSAGRSQFLSCMSEGSCDDDQFRSCVPYLRY